MQYFGKLQRLSVLCRVVIFGSLWRKHENGKFYQDRTEIISDDHC